MKTVLTLVSIEGRLVWKGMDILIFGIFFPVLLSALFGYLLSRDATQGPSNFQLSFAAVTTIGILATGVMGLPLTIADYRHRGILKRFQVTPVSPALLLAAQGLIQLIAALLSLAAVVAVYHVFFQFRLGGSWLVFLGVYLFVMAAMYSIGLLIGSLVPNQRAANLWSSLAYFIMLLFSGATIPYEVMPRFAQWLMDLLPLANGIHLLKQAAVGESLGGALPHAAVLTACTIIGVWGTAKHFRWK